MTGELKNLPLDTISGAIFDGFVHDVFWKFLQVRNNDHARYGIITKYLRGDVNTSKTSAASSKIY